jgi:hypothetical protein
MMRLTALKCLIGRLVSDRNCCYTLEPTATLTCGNTPFSNVMNPLAEC